MKKTKKQYEQYLNEIYADAFSMSEAEDNFIYLAKTKSAASRLKTIHNAYHNHTIGSLLRKNDPIAFNVGFSDWCMIKPTIFIHSLTFQNEEFTH